MKTVHSAYSFLLLVLVYELPLFDHVDHFWNKKNNNQITSNILNMSIKNIILFELS